ncbi:hypothetical protein U1Q18_009498 [Sarracenia purpurea var. burkii]
MAFCISDPPRAIFVFGFQYGLRASQSSTAIWIRDYAHGESHDRLVLLSEAWLDERRMQMKLAEPQYDLAEKSSIMDKLSLESKAMAAPNKMGTMIQKFISKNKGNQILQRTGSSRERLPMELAKTTRCGLGLKWRRCYKCGGCRRVERVVICGRSLTKKLTIDQYGGMRRRGDWRSEDITRVAEQ